MPTLISRAMDMRDEHQKCWRWTFFLSNFFMLFLTIAFIACGAKVTKMNVFHEHISFIWTEYVVAILFFTLFYFGMFCFGMCIMAKKFSNINRAVGCYAFFMFLIGFLVMATQGGVLGALEGIDILDLQDACRANPEQLKKIQKENPLGWLIVPLSKWGNAFDDKTESLLNGGMCTETCPCYQSEARYRDDERSGKRVRADAYYKYGELSRPYLKDFGRVFYASDALPPNQQFIPFKWEKDPAKSYESFWDCYRAWAKMAETDATINMKEKFKSQYFNSEEERKSRKGHEQNDFTFDDIKWYVELEDQYTCSETCLHHVRKYMMENGVPFTTCCVLLSITGLWMFMVSFCMCKKQEQGQQDAHDRQDQYLEDMDKVEGPHYPPNYSGDIAQEDYNSGAAAYMHGEGTRVGGQEQNEQAKSPAQLRAEAFDKKRQEAKYRGVSKESRIEMQMKQRRQEEADKIEQERGPSQMKW